MSKSAKKRSPSKSASSAPSAKSSRRTAGDARPENVNSGSKQSRGRGAADRGKTLRGCLSWRCLLQGPPMHALIVGYVPEFGFATHRRLDLLYFSHASKLA